MSLNGLNDATIKEAHDAAAAEPGGWFLLKYASRDEIELLGRGNGGVVEIRNAISEYEETSPLYGFLRYRRRNVLIKYLPEGCSRLIQARVAVHFNAICERFSPHDTTFSIAIASELKDTKLSSACSLHAASGSTSSSTSSQKRRKLGEIAEEDEEEQQRASKRYSSAEPDPSKPVTAPEQSTTESKLAAPPNPEPPVTLNAELATSPEKGNFTTATDPPDFIGVPRPPSPAKSFDTSARRMSSQSTRTDFYSYSYGRQKVKLAPRPSVDVSGRPRTATGGNYRPVSTIPAGFKLFSKGSKKGKSKDSASDHSSSSPEAQKAVPEINFANIPIPELPPSPVMEELRRPHTSSGRPSTSSGASFTLSPLKAAPVKDKMTPEKARLMKAMQMREKRKKASMLQQEPSLPTPAPVAEPGQEGEPDDAKPVEALSEESADQDPSHLEADKDDDPLSLSKADSGIVLDTAASAITDQASEVTQTDESHPASPFIASSEPDHSTKASSLSESTDETIGPAIAAKEEDTRDEVPAPNEAEEIITVAVTENPTEVPQPVEIETAITSLEEATTALSEDFTEAAEPVETKAETIENTPSTLAEHPAEDIQPTETEVETVEDREVQAPTEAIPSVAREDDNEEPAEAEEDVPPPRRIGALPVSKFSTANTASVDHDDGAEEPSSPVAEVDEPRRDERRMSLRIPKSKFSTHDLRAAAGPEDIPEVPPKTHETEARPAETAGGETHSTDDGADLEHRPDRISVPSKSSRRSVNLEPIKIDITRGRSPRSSCHLSDDEDLLDELQSATVEEALPVTVSKSPATPVFPTISAGKEGAPMGSSLRTASQPGTSRASTLLSPMDARPATGVRSISSGAAFLHKITTQQQPGAAPLAPKKTNIGIGSSISQRIKALEKLSSNSTAAGEPEARPNAPSPSFFSVRKKPTVREPSRSPSFAERASSFTKSSPPPAISQESSPDTSRQRSRERSGSLAKRLTMFESSSPSRGRASESVSVRARIVRDPSQPLGNSPPYKDPSEYAPLELKQSPLIVDHRRAPQQDEPMPESNPAPAPPPKETIQERRMSREKGRSESRDRDAEMETKLRRSSLSIVKDFIKDRRKSLTSPSADNLLGAPTPSTPSRSPSRPPSTHQNNSNASFARRLSISSRRSSVSKDTANAPPTVVAMSPSSYTETSCSGDEKSSVSGGGEKRSKGRAGRFMRRLSSSLGSSRKNTPTGISPTLHEEVSAEAVDAAASAGNRSATTAGGPPSIAAYMGDVNVQFPDNLLWKRRWMCLDSQGFLILSTVAGGAGAGPLSVAGATPVAGVKRYHMSELRAPYTPEMEVQELPNSVVLDFVEGSGLQIACEDRAGQLHVLHTLQDAHRNHSSFGQ